MAGKNTPRKIASRINEDPLLRNVVLAVCAVIVFVFICSMLLNIATRHGRHRTVPDFTGMELREAKREARRASLRLEVADSIYQPAVPGGTVLDQNPAPGASVKPGRRIFLTTNFYAQPTVAIPYVTGFSLRQAKNNLEVAGLEIEKLVYRPDLAGNCVLEELYKGRTVTQGGKQQAEVGSGVTLIVGLADGSAVKVPKLVGFPLKVAKSRLWEMGLNVGRIEQGEGINIVNIAEARVWSQSPEQGESVAPGREVSFRLTLDEEKVASGSQSSDHSARRIIATQQVEQDEQNAQGAQ